MTSDIAVKLAKLKEQLQPLFEIGMIVRQTQVKKQRLPDYW